MWNFNKSSFLIGKITSQLVVTGLEKLRKAKKLQPGNREWVTLLAKGAQQIVHKIVLMREEIARL